MIGEESPRIGFWIWCCLRIHNRPRIDQDLWIMSEYRRPANRMMDLKWIAEANQWCIRWSSRKSGSSIRI